MDTEYRQTSTTSLMHKIKLKTSLCCFSSSVRDHEPLESDEDKQRTPRSPRSWLKSTAQEIPEIREKCANLISRISCRPRRRSRSADFSYDPDSYALNFEDDTRVDELPLNFSARLAASSLSTVKFADDTVAPRRREICAFSWELVGLRFLVVVCMHSVFIRVYGSLPRSGVVWSCYIAIQTYMFDKFDCSYN